jgi:hypothetical protein
MTERREFLTWEGEAVQVFYPGGNIHVVSVARTPFRTVPSGQFLLRTRVIRSWAHQVGLPCV